MTSLGPDRHDKTVPMLWRTRFAASTPPILLRMGPQLLKVLQDTVLILTIRFAWSSSCYGPGSKSASAGYCCSPWHVATVGKKNNSLVTLTLRICRSTFIYTSLKTNSLSFDASPWKNARPAQENRVFKVRYITQLQAVHTQAYVCVALKSCRGHKLSLFLIKYHTMKWSTSVLDGVVSYRPRLLYLMCNSPLIPIG
jgi:hypothetical protein